MKVKSWKAEISILVSEGTDSGRQTFLVEGSTTDAASLPEAIAQKTAAMMAILGDKAQLKKDLDVARGDLADANKRIELLKEANDAAKATTRPAGGSDISLPPSESPAELPVKRAKKK